MHADCVPAPEATSSAGAGGSVRTQKTVTAFEVSVPVPLDLPGVYVPVATGSDPAENRRLPEDVSDRPRIVVFVIASPSSINVTSTTTVLRGPAVSARLQKWHMSDFLNRQFGGMLTRGPPESAEGDGGMDVSLIPFKNTGGGWRNGTRGGCLMTLANGGLRDEVGSH